MYFFSVSPNRERRHASAVEIVAFMTRLVSRSASADRREVEWNAARRHVDGRTPRARFDPAGGSWIIEDGKRWTIPDILKKFSGSREGMSRAIVELGGLSVAG